MHFISCERGLVYTNPRLDGLDGSVFLIVIPASSIVLAFEGAEFLETPPTLCEYPIERAEHRHDVS